MAAALTIGVFGSLIGSFLNVVIHRVPAGRSLLRPGSSCGSCGHAVRWYDNLPLVSWVVLRGRCRDCRARISGRYPLIEIGTAAAFVLVAAVFAPPMLSATSPGAVIAAGVLLVSMLYLAAISVALAAIDLETHRLPNPIVIPAYLVGAVLLLAAAASSGDWSVLVSGGAGVVIMGGVYAVPLLVRPDAIGGGDVKLAGVLGLFLGWLGWAPLFVGIVAGFLLGGLYGAALILAGRGRSARIAFGPWLLAGAWVGILAGDAVLSGYLGLLGLAI